MVRLKGGLDYKHRIVVPVFQFQNGTIKSRCRNQFKKAFRKFQFQNGTIKRQDIFHSLQFVFLFQFQNGTIKRRL